MYCIWISNSPMWNSPMYTLPFKYHDTFWWASYHFTFCWTFFWLLEFWRKLDGFWLHGWLLPFYMWHWLFDYSYLLLCSLDHDSDLYWSCHFYDNFSFDRWGILLDNQIRIFNYKCNPTWDIQKLRNWFKELKFNTESDFIGQLKIITFLIKIVQLNDLLMLFSIFPSLQWYEGCVIFAQLFRNSKDPRTVIWQETKKTFSKYC